MSIENRSARKRHTALTWGMIVLMFVATLFVVGIVRDETAEMLHPIFEGSKASATASLLVFIVTAYTMHSCLKRLWSTKGRMLGALKACIAFILAALVVLGAAAITSAAWFALA